MEGSEDKHNSEAEFAGISVFMVFNLYASKGLVKMSLRLSGPKKGLRTLILNSLLNSVSDYKKSYCH